MSPDSDYLSLLLEDDISNVLDGVIEGCDVFEFGYIMQQPHHLGTQDATTTSPRDTGTSVPSSLRWYLTIPQVPSSNSLGWSLSSWLLNPKP